MKTMNTIHKVTICVLPFLSEPAEQLIRAPGEIGRRLMIQVSQPIGEDEEEQSTPK